jgi:small subunit ribosomal protein S18
MLTSTSTPAEKKCFYCVHGVKEVDYKDSQTLRRFISSYGKIAPTRRSGLCAKHQRKVALGVKRARIMALLPFTSR